MMENGNAYKTFLREMIYLRDDNESFICAIISKGDEMIMRSFLNGSITPVKAFKAYLASWI